MINTNHLVMAFSLYSALDKMTRAPDDEASLSSSRFTPRLRIAIGMLGFLLVAGAATIAGVLLSQKVNFNKHIVYS